MDIHSPGSTFNTKHPVAGQAEATHLYQDAGELVRVTQYARDQMATELGALNFITGYPTSSEFALKGAMFPIYLVLEKSDYADPPTLSEIELELGPSIPSVTPPALDVDHFYSRFRIRRRF